jgi:hypothetical protein
MCDMNSILGQCQPTSHPESGNYGYSFALRNADGSELALFWFRGADTAEKARTMLQGAEIMLRQKGNPARYV